jgi:hypothetical protein
VTDPVFRCLDLTFSVRADDPQLQAIVEHIYAACATVAAPATCFSVRQSARGSGASEVLVDGDCVRVTSTPALALAHLVWEINRRTVTASSRMLLLHAAAAERDGTVVLLPAPSGAGKSTTVAALVAAGLRYLTDEAAAIDPDTGAVRPYPKPIALNASHIIGNLGPVPAATERYVGGERYVTAAELDAAIGDGGVPRLVVVPQFTRDLREPVRRVELSRAETLVLLAEQSFNFRELGVAALEQLARLVRGCRSYRLEFRDLDAAVPIICASLDEARTASVGDLT